MLESPSGKQACSDLLVISLSSRGLLGRRGVPDPIAKNLQGIFKDAMENPELIEKMDKGTLAMKPMAGEEYGGSSGEHRPASNQDGRLKKGI